MTKSKLTPPEVVEKMYLQINNISQGFAIAILIDTLAKRFMDGTHIFVPKDDIIPLLLAITSLGISIIFWTRYYFDTYIINRSFSVRSITWFFLYIISEGFCFRQINEPVNWLFSTGIFLVFGLGFYVLNLLEIRRKINHNVEINLPTKRTQTAVKRKKYKGRASYKYNKSKIKFVRKIQKNILTIKRKRQQKRDEMTVLERFIFWQKQLLVDLFILALLTFIVGFMAKDYPAYLYIASPTTLFFALWQLLKSRIYKQYGFSNSIS